MKVVILNTADAHGGQNRIEQTEYIDDHCKDHSSDHIEG